MLRSFRSGQGGLVSVRNPPGYLDHYEPSAFARHNRTYQDLATHYGTTVLPARPRAPRDKAKVEAGGQIVDRRILALLRNHAFFSPAELKREIRRPREKLNDHPSPKLEGTSFLDDPILSTA